MVWQILDSRTPAALRRLMMRSARRHADVLMYNGRALQAMHEEGRPTCVPSFVFTPVADPEELKPDPGRRERARGRLGVPEDALLVGTMANINPMKGIEYFVRAAEKVYAARSDAWFLIAGATYRTHEAYRVQVLREIGESGVPRERFVLSSEPAVPLYPALDVKVISSVPSSEGTTTTAIEAMACGVPVVADGRRGGERGGSGRGDRPSRPAVRPRRHRNRDRSARGRSTAEQSPGSRGSQDRARISHARGRRRRARRRVPSRNGPARSRTMSAHVEGDRPTEASVVVANPGGQRWLLPATTALAEAGLLRSYVTPMAPIDPASRLLQRLPGRMGAAARRELALRPLPSGVEASRYQRAATVAELLRVGAMRGRLSNRSVEALMLWRARKFDAAAARRLAPGDRAVIAETMAARDTFRRAASLKCASLLDYPTAHYEFYARTLAEEAVLRPDYAPTLQMVDATPSVRHRVVEELRAADRVLVLTSQSRRTFIEAGVDERKLVLTPLGVELDLFRPVPRDPDDPTFRVLFSGQLTQRKGLSYLVDGFLRAGLPSSELVLLGAVVGTSRPWRHHQALKHVPPVPFEQLPRFYATSDVFVLPSLVEGFPQTALQAMACGLPVIVSDNTFGADVIDDGVNGYIVPIRDSDAIAERIRYLHDHPDERMRMGAAARARAEDFPWERYGQAIVAAVREVL